MAINLSQITHLPQPLQNKLSELDSDNDGQVTYDDVLQIFGDRVTPDYFSALEEAVSNNDRESILHSWRLITSANQTIRHGIFKKYPLLDQKETKANTERSPTTKQQRSREKQIDLLRHIEGLSNISIQDNTVSADYLDTPCSAFCSESTDLINQLYFESDKKRGILNIEFDDQGYLHSVYDYNNYALDVYDENERPVFRRTSSLHEYYDSKGKLYHPDEHFAAITPTALNETGTDPLEAIKSQITDPSEMLAYDQTYLSVFSKAPPFPPETILAIRQYAKELLGIAEQEERLCTAFNELGISFETELENMVIEGNLSLCRPTLRFLIDSFNMLENQALPFLKTLPPDIIETSDFQSLNIGSHISSGSSTFPGLAIEGRIIFLSAANNFRTFVHEFCHVMDMNHQRPEYRSRDEHDWGMSIYGEDYKYMRNYKVGFGYRPEGFTSQYAFDGKSM